MNEGKMYSKSLSGMTALSKKLDAQDAAEAAFKAKNSLKTYKISIETGPTAHDVERIEVKAKTPEEARKKAEAYAKKHELRSPMINEPQLVKEAVAGPFKKFKKGQVVTVKKTGEKVEVLRQDDIGLVFTASKDAVKIPDDKRLKVVPGKGYKEFMPRELQEGILTFKEFLSEGRAYDDKKFYTCSDEGRVKGPYNSKKEAEEAASKDKTLHVVTGKEVNDALD